jgi:hypothetical protein
MFVSSQMFDFYFDERPSADFPKKAPAESSSNNAFVFFGTPIP